ncbi:MAG: hypothetical protein Q8S14_04620 [Algoriphagus sp.]|uniref:hypothetical protein n=1 Tax=Algoriphagus sp. TaxID=1872435 RepID=UPI0027316A12|nr:hypothetical protein [Algoriphagus sp.]MDP2041978.1 hypothetical protein [Algoriphagus sp.]MDP3471138.1 hypothetical protein [Algoriphagus sp.]
MTKDLIRTHIPLVIGLLAIASVWLLPWRFQVNDDVVMMWLVSGAYTGSPESYAVFIHPLLSWFFSLLYRSFPLANWYAGTWFWTIGISFFLIFKKLEFSSNPVVFKRFLLVVILALCLHFCYFLQFTQVAGLACLASLIHLFGIGGNKNRILSGIALVLFVLALLIRWEAVVLVGIGFLAWKVSRFGSQFFQNNLKNLVFIVVSFGVVLVGKLFWESQSEFVDFLEFNKARASVIDHPVFRQDVVKDKIDRNSDWYFFANWYFEEGFPTIDQLHAKKTELDARLLSVAEVSNSLKRLFQIQKTEAFKSMLILVFVGSFWLIYFDTRRAIIFALGWLIFFFLFNHFFLIQGRVIVVFFLPFLIPILEFQGDMKGDKKWKIGSLILFTALIVHTINFLKEAEGRKQMDKEFIQLSEGIREGDPIFVEGYHSHNSTLMYSLANPAPMIVTGWIARSPFQQRALRRFGLNRFGEMEHYALFSVVGQTEIVFPRYANHAFGIFELEKVSSSKNFVLQEFIKK